MDKATREKAPRMLAEKAAGSGATYSDIALETGYDKRQPIRLSKRVCLIASKLRI